MDFTRYLHNLINVFAHIFSLTEAYMDSIVIFAPYTLWDLSWGFTGFALIVVLFRGVFSHRES